MYTRELILNNGIHMPQLALGTWLMSPEEAHQSTMEALRLGYRHIDTAQAYENEAGVGSGWRASGVPREKVFITSKVAAEIKSYEGAKASIEQSLRVSGLDYFDLMLIHCPQPWDEYAKNPYRYEAENRAVWQALEEAYEAGKVRAIGVSNFSEYDIDSLMQTCKIAPMVNQIYCHIGHTPNRLIEYCRDHHIAVEAYSPVAHGRALADSRIAAMAERYNVSIAQLCIRYCLQLGLAALPKSTNPAHIAQNAEVEFSIRNEDMQALQGKDIYLAGGCFWGIEHLFKQIDGVIETEAGFANGQGAHPSYKAVYTDATGHAETVHVRYDPTHVSLETLLKMYFCAIDPVSLNKQGEDEGTRYRTGIYYTDPADRQLIDEAFASEQKKYDKPIAVERMPLQAFYTAEEEHQDYLEKHPDGYCHLRRELFEMARQLKNAKQNN